MFIRWSTLLLSSTFILSANAANLMDAYHAAEMSDPTFQQAIDQRLVTKEGVPISMAQLLPALALTVEPSITRTGVSGSAYGSVGTGVLAPRNNTQKGNTIALTLTQTVFNFSEFAGVASSLALSKGADATLNAAMQSLMVRVANAYFAVLKDEENLAYNAASKRAYTKQLDQARQQYKVGLKTLTDVYTAEASYDSSLAGYIAAETTLANDRENLRAITGVYYPHLSKLSDRFPLITPQPKDSEKWVATALRQNWSVKAAQYTAESAKQVIYQQYGGHMPSLNFEATMNRVYSLNNNDYDTVTMQRGPGAVTNRQIAFDLTVPILAGGGVIAATNQAIYNYQLTTQQLEQVVRNTATTTRQSYMSLLAGISQVRADQLAIKSTISSLDGLEESYRVGTETLVDVLNQQQKVYQAQTQYASDRYAFISNYLALKQAAGTLSVADLQALNQWLR